MFVGIIIIMQFCTYFYLRLVTVSSRHDPAVADQRTTTEVVSTVQRNLIWNTILGALKAPDNFIILIQRSGI